MHIEFELEAGGKDRTKFELEFDEVEAPTPVKTRIVRTHEQMTDEELERNADEAFKKLDEMSDEELEEHMRKVEEGQK